MNTPIVSIDRPLPGEPLAELAEALWEGRDDAVACRFVVDGALPDPTDAAGFRAFLESPPVREGLLGASQILDDRHRAHILPKASLYRSADIRFEETDAPALSDGLIRLLEGGGAGLVAAFLNDAGVRPGKGVRPGRGVPRARRIADFLRHLLRRLLRRPRTEPGVRLFRSATRWAFWVAGRAQFTAAVFDAGRSRVTVLVVGWDEPGVSAWWLDTATRVPAVEPDGSVPPAVEPLAVEPLDVPAPAIAAFQASLRLSGPNAASLWLKVAAPAFRGAVREVDRRIAEGGLLPRLLADPLVRRRAGANPFPASGTPASGPPASGPTFGRGEVEALMRRLARLMEEGGTFSGTRIEPPSEVAATLGRMAEEIYGGDPSRALAYVSYDRWSPWFVGVLLSTSVFVDTATGAVTILMLCERD